MVYNVEQHLDRLSQLCGFYFDGAYSVVDRNKHLR